MLMIFCVFMMLVFMHKCDKNKGNKFKTIVNEKDSKKKK
jgi:hypothetical protein